MDVMKHHTLDLDSLYYRLYDIEDNWVVYRQVTSLWAPGGIQYVSSPALYLKFTEIVWHNQNNKDKRPIAYAFRLKDFPNVIYEYTDFYCIPEAGTFYVCKGRFFKPILTYNYFTTLSSRLDAYLSLFDLLSFTHVAYQESPESHDRLPHWVFELDYNAFEVPISSYDVDYTIPEIEIIFPYTPFVDLIDHVPVLTIPLKTFNFLKDSTNTTADRFGYSRKRFQSFSGFIHVSILESMSKWLWLVKYILFYFAGPLLYYVLIFISFSKFFSKLRKLAFIDDRNFFQRLGFCRGLHFFYSSCLFVFMFILRSSGRVCWFYSL